MAQAMAHPRFVMERLQFELSEAQRALHLEEALVETLLDPEWRPPIFEDETLAAAREHYVAATRKRRDGDRARRAEDFEQAQLLALMRLTS